MFMDYHTMSYIYPLKYDDMDLLDEINGDTHKLTL